MQNQNIFGGLAILIVGDLMQLRPPMANYVFGEPYNTEFLLPHYMDPLFEKFQCMTLTTNHRHSSDKDYANLLEKIRFGEHELEEIELLKTRVVTDLTKIPEDALMICGTNVAVENFNKSKLNEAGGEIHESEAIKVPPIGNKTYKFPELKDGRLDNTPFMNKLQVKEGANVILTYNINVRDKLSNGQRGVVHKLIFDKNGSLECVMVDFYNQDVGHEQMKKHKLLLVKYGLNCVPIFKISHQCSIGKLQKGHSARGTVIQFPLRLSSAITSHKAQGQTVKKPKAIITDMSTIFGPNMAYVILSRVQSKEQLYIINFEADKIIASEECKQKVFELQQKEVLTNSLWFKEESGYLKISFINVQSLKSHLINITSDFTIMQSDFIFCLETWLEKDEFMAHQIEGFQHLAIENGRGKGISLFYKVNCSIVCQTISQEMEIMAVDVKDSRLICVYNKNKNPDVVSRKILNLTKNRSTVAFGDFNLAPLVQLAPHFQQHVAKPTFDQGSLIDHVYSNFAIEEVIQHSVIFSDHDCLSLIVKY